MITTEEMARLDKESEKYGMTALKLMENAGEGVALIVAQRYPPAGRTRILVVCYHGNNGGDGFVAARHLKSMGFDVHVCFIGSTDKLKGPALTNFERLDADILVSFDKTTLEDYDVIIDALLGTGAQGALREPLASAVKAINKSGAHVVAVDVPTGMNPDSGETSEPTIEAELIVTFHDVKVGLEKAGLKECCIVVDIGIPESLLKR